MKNILLYSSRLLVGSLLLISGVIKANDALGFSYKLNDYFTEGILGMEFLRPYTLIIAASICILEIVLGVALIFGLKAKLVTTINVLMMLFFTFLTFYSAYFDKVKDCGCFGDALKLTPWESFTKDVVLLFFSIILFIYRKQLFPNMKTTDFKYIIPSVLLIALFAVGVTGWWFPVFFSILVYSLMFIIKRFDQNQWRLLSLSLIASLVFTVYCYNNLPIKDFRPYKLKANIPEGMVVSPDALPELVEYQWEFLVNGKKEIHSTRDGSFPTVQGGEFTNKVETIVIREAEEPKIHDFTIEGTQDDTELFLSKDNVLVVVAYDFAKSSDEGFRVIKKATDQAIKKGYTVIGMTAESAESRAEKVLEYDLNFDFYFCDGITLKTIVRANPGVFEMDRGTIQQKLHWNNIDKLLLETLPTAKLKYNFKLKKQLDSIMLLDQKYRDENYQQNFLKQAKIDSTNLMFIENIFKEHGYPGKSIVGEDTNSTAWYVVQHSGMIEKYLPLIKEAGDKNEIPKRLVAMMEDRYLMSKGEEQIYGTQGRIINMQSENPIQVIWPIKNPETVNARREKMGLTSTVEENSKRIFGSEFVYKSYTLDDIKKL